MNIDTDTQWATLGISIHTISKIKNISGLGNPEGDDVPNKKYYDPRVWLRAGQVALVDRVKQAFADLNAVDLSKRFDLNKAGRLGRLFLYLNICESGLSD